jgi:hypothetical protein
MLTATVGGHAASPLPGGLIFVAGGNTEYGFQSTPFFADRNLYEASNAVAVFTDAPKRHRRYCERTGELSAIIDVPFIAIHAENQHRGVR